MQPIKFLRGAFRRLESSLHSNYDNQKATERIEMAVQHLRSTLNKQLSNLENNLKTTSGDIHEVVEERKRLAKQLQLDQKLTEIYEEVKLYPTWSQWDVDCEIDNPKGEKRDKENDISFSLNGHAYKFTFYDEDSMGSDYLPRARLSLRDGFDKLLIEIKVTFSEHVGSVGLLLWKPCDVSAFVPGAWIQDFLEFYEKFLANIKQRNLKEKYKQQTVKDLKNKFGLR